VSLEKALFGAGVSHERHLLRYPAEIASVFSQTGLRLETAFVITWMCFGTVRKACFYIYIYMYLWQHELTEFCSCKPRHNQSNNPSYLAKNTLTLHLQKPRFFSMVFLVWTCMLTASFCRWRSQHGVLALVARPRWTIWLCRSLCSYSPLTSLKYGV